MNTQQHYDEQELLLNFNNPLISCYCKGGFEPNEETKHIKPPRSSPYSIYVNDKLHITIHPAFFSSYPSAVIELRTFLFESENNFESINEYTMVLQGNETEIIIPIRRDNSSMRKNRKNTARSIAGEPTKEDLEMKKKMRRSITQEATKKVSFIQVSYNDTIVAISENLWCKSKTREEMEKKKAKKNATKKNPATKRKAETQTVELIPCQLDNAMIEQHLPNTKRNKATPLTIPTFVIPSEMFQMPASDWMIANTDMNSAQDFQLIDQLQKEAAVTNIYQDIPMDDMQIIPEDFQELFQNMSQNSPTGGYNLDEMNFVDWDSIIRNFEVPQNIPSTNAYPTSSITSKAVDLDSLPLFDFDFSNELTF